MNIFLKAKAWQLFLLTSIPFVTYQALSFSIVFAPLNQPLQERMIIPDMYHHTFMLMRYKPISFVLGAVVIGWLWAVGVYFQNLLTDNLRSNVNIFKLALIYNMIYMTVFWLLMPLFMSFDIYRIIFYYITPFNVVFIPSMVYSVYFVSKSINTVERKRPVSFGDFAGDFFLINLFPVGIWMIQPRIKNQLSNQSSLTK